MLASTGKGKHKDIDMEIGGEILSSKESEKLLGLKMGVNPEIVIGYIIVRG